jgi:hypothetical protein
MTQDHTELMRSTAFVLLVDQQGALTEIYLTHKKSNLVDFFRMFSIPRCFQGWSEIVRVA